MEQTQFPHHIKQPYCETRPKYRRGRKLTAVKVFTISDESKYLLVTNVHATKLENDVLKMCSSFGMVKQFSEVQNYPQEPFTQTFLVQFINLQAAKTAKRMIDEKNFYGKMLHVCYAPEYETVGDVKEKVQHRLRSVTSRVKHLEKENAKLSHNRKSGKRKGNGNTCTELKRRKLQGPVDNRIKNNNHNRQSPSFEPVNDQSAFFSEHACESNVVASTQHSDPVIIDSSCSKSSYGVQSTSKSSDSTRKNVKLKRPHSSQVKAENNSAKIAYRMNKSKSCFVPPCNTISKNISHGGSKTNKATGVSSINASHQFAFVPRSLQMKTISEINSHSNDEPISLLGPYGSHFKEK